MCGIQNHKEKTMRIPKPSARKILNQKVWEVAPLIADLEELKGHYISKDIVRLSEQIKWTEKKKK